MRQYGSRWKEGIRLLLYGLIVFFVPFIFVGGIPTMVWYFQFILLYGKQSYCSWTNIRNVLLSISQVLGQYENSDSFVIFFKIAENLFLLLCLLSLFKTKERWKQALIVFISYSDFFHTPLLSNIPLPSSPRIIKKTNGLCHPFFV